MSNDDSCQRYPGMFGVRMTNLAKNMTKRELFAAMMMQGILSSLPERADYNTEVTAHVAVAHADALIAELEKKK